MLLGQSNKMKIEKCASSLVMRSLVTLDESCFSGVAAGVKSLLEVIEMRAGRGKGIVVSF